MATPMSIIIKDYLSLYRNLETVISLFLSYCTGDFNPLHIKQGCHMLMLYCLN